MQLKPSVKKRWLEALRSGKIKQARGQLRKENNSMCCLGVLCNLHAESHPKTAAKQKKADRYMGCMQLPPETVLQWAFKGWNTFDYAGIYIEYVGRLSEKNDAGASFKQIADIIEKHL